MDDANNGYNEVLEGSVTSNTLFDKNISTSNENGQKEICYARNWYVEFPKELGVDNSDVANVTIGSLIVTEQMDSQLFFLMRFSAMRAVLNMTQSTFDFKLHIVSAKGEDIVVLTFYDCTVNDLMPSEFSKSSNQNDELALKVPVKFLKLNISC